MVYNTVHRVNTTGPGQTNLEEDMKLKLSSVLGIGLVVLVVAVFFVTISGPLVGKVFSTINASLDYRDADGIVAEEPAGAPPALAENSAAPEVGAADQKTAPGGLDANGIVANTTLPEAPQPQTGHMIIKNADIKLQVEDTDSAIDRSTQIVGDVGGYIISSRVWYQDINGTNYKYATISIGVPVDQFENAMRRLRTLAVRVLDENASGQDVTSEFVDLQSQLGNLEATRDRIRSFLDDAKTVEESLKINEQLTAIEDQIEKVKGRMNFLSGRSSYSTITVNLEPKVPELTPTPTPTLRPTPTPTVWSPGKTFDAAKETVTSAYQGIIDFLISFFIIVVPILLPPLLIIWAIWKFATRKSGKPASGG
jgi:hypothetical protein